MTKLLNRQYRLVIGLPPEIVSVPDDDYIEPNVFKQGTIIGSLDTSLTNDFRTESGKKLRAREFRELRMIADVTSSAKAGGSKGSNTTIQLYNLSEDSLTTIEQKNAQVILEAGYYSDFSGEEKTLPLLFTGQIREVKTLQSGEDRITVMECTAAQAVNDSVRVSKYFPESDSSSEFPALTELTGGSVSYLGNTLGTVIEYLIGIYGDNGVPLGQYVGRASEEDRVDYVQLFSPDDIPLVNGYSVTGFLHQALDKVTAQCGYIWYIANGRLFIHPRGYTKSVEQFTLDNNLIKSIEGVKDNKKDKITGVTISTFLDARMSIDKRIEITEGKYEGVYKIIQATHNLDNELGAWDTVLTCQTLVQ
ncbi:hypothetical protein [Pseudoalteromonas phage J2-1]|uniref:Uncharacterized protein n=1 Tax=Pseudoalteromonas phage J2-1 TaxID=2023998 RepID=A0A223LHB9_9CAUD|nr:baseplate hub [Pseudoalteromonas phage J2-1]ASU03365.1 hypothetical protein [Pseudoalteromonas phage J2-1]